MYKIRAIFKIFWGIFKQKLGRTIFKLWEGYFKMRMKFLNEDNY